MERDGAQSLGSPSVFFPMKRQGAKGEGRVMSSLNPKYLVLTTTYKDDIS